jgi:hypothetical protein
MRPDVIPPRQARRAVVRLVLPRALLGFMLLGALPLGVIPLGVIPIASAQDLGRIFFTPQQRQELDRRRNLNVTESEVVVESLVTVNGHVARSGGKTTTWINGVPQYDTFRGSTPDRVGVASTDSAVGVKVGQTLDRSKGEVRDTLPDGAIKVNPAAR